MNLRVRAILLFICLNPPALQAQSTPATALLVLNKRDNALVIVDPTTRQVMEVCQLALTHTKWWRLRMGSLLTSPITAVAAARSTPCPWWIWLRERHCRR